MTEDAQMKIRLPRMLKSSIDRAALDMNRTLNAEIVARLERTFIEDAERASENTDMQDQIDSLKRRIARILETNGLTDPDAMTTIEADEAPERGSGALLERIGRS